MMTIGVRAHDYGRQPIGSLCHAIALDGWKCVQLAFTKAIEGIHTFSDVTPAIVKETKNVLDEKGLSVAVLGVYVEPSLANEAERVKQANILLTALS